MSNKGYDTIVIGSGQGGKRLAVALANAGRKVALVEREHVGGTCVNVGCTPTKTMVASARVAHLVDRAADYGINTGPADIDLKVVRKRKRDIVASFRGSNEKSIEKTDNLELLRGEASFQDTKTLKVNLNDGNTETISADTIVINTGTRNVVPSIKGADTVDSLDSTSIMELDSVPEHLIVVGGGYIGLEFGQMFRRFGANVTIIQRADHLLDREDDDVTEALAEILTEEGIDIWLEAQVSEISQSGAEITVTAEVDGETKKTTGSHLLFATGRKPNTDSLNPDAAGLDLTEHGYVKVNDRLETNVDGIYALGDVVGGPAFTHISYDDYRILEQNLLHDGAATTTGRLVPYTLFTDPQLGRVGLSEKGAKAKGVTYKLAKVPMTHVARALETDETRGFMKALVDPESKKILGCAILGIEGGEVMSAVQIAMMGDLPYTSLRDTALAHPTLAESLNTLFASVED